MIKKLIKKLFSKKTTEIECAIDEQVVDCKEIDADPYVGVPAPIESPVDDWFETPPKTEMQMEFEAFKQEAHKFYGTKEPENIHQLMYDMATESGKHTTAAWFDTGNIGGSENFQENTHQ
tara:strand:+ start:748 stop:1107 length:360 start_codon:yes stop_codon:yes gene_type:complete